MISEICLIGKLSDKYLSKQFDEIRLHYSTFFESDGFYFFQFTKKIFAIR